MHSPCTIIAILLEVLNLKYKTVIIVKDWSIKVQPTPFLCQFAHRQTERSLEAYYCIVEEMQHSISFKRMDWDSIHWCRGVLSSGDSWEWRLRCLKQERFKFGPGRVIELMIQSVWFGFSLNSSFVLLWT